MNVVRGTTKTLGLLDSEVLQLLWQLRQVVHELKTDVADTWCQHAENEHGEETGHQTPTKDWIGTTKVGPSNDVKGGRQDMPIKGHEAQNHRHFHGHHLQGLLFGPRIGGQLIGAPQALKISS